MRYVLDSSVGVKWALAEQDTSKARKLRDDFRNSLIELMAPDVVPIEIAHAISRAERQRRITQTEGLQLFTDVLTTLPSLVDSLPLLPRAYELSSSFKIGIYDCLYVALALREQCELITADSRLVNAVQAQFGVVRSLATMP